MNFATMQTFFATTSTGFEYYGKPDGTSVPNTMNKADQIFGFGHYNNILRVEKTKSGSLEFGLTLTNALTNNWLAFDDFHVYYGKTKEVLLDTLVTQNKTYANIRSERVLRKGILEAICLRYVPDINSFESVYELASADNDKVVLLPANEMKAGYVYFVKVANDTPLGADDEKEVNKHLVSLVQCSILVAIIFTVVGYLGLMLIIIEVIY